MTKAPLRLMIFDDTCRGKAMLPGLTHSWIAGGHLYRGLGRLDQFRGVRSWAEGLSWLADVEPGRTIEEIQFWGHGKWGKAQLGGEPLDESVLTPRHPLLPALAAIRARLSGAQALWWFRSCETFGVRRGQAFAESWASYMGCRAAGHTFVIGFWQSGLHSLVSGQAPHWPLEEGLPPGSDPERPKKALWSRPGRPNTITCLSGKLPAGY